MSYKDFSSKSSYTYTEIKDWEKDTVKEKAIRISIMVIMNIIYH